MNASKIRIDPTFAATLITAILGPIIVKVAETVIDEITDAVREHRKERETSPAS